MTEATTLQQLSRAALNDYIENHLANAARPLSLAEVFRDVYPGQRATDCALLALRKRLQYLAAEGRLQSDGYGDGRTWSGITEAQRAEQAAQEAAHQAAQAARVALPRRVDVMSGNYVPARGPALRAGAMDFRSCPSVGYRC